MCALKTPVLFLVFNRPAETARVFETIRAQRPSQLFVASDGADPDHNGEEALVEETRVIATCVDWPCEVKTLYRNTHLGCGLAVSRAISWFFEHVKEGIILEDDCLPHPDFFPYCEKLLTCYRDELRVATIGGAHCLPTVLTHAHSHYVSKYFQKGGWATWRRTWQLYDFDLTKLSPEGCHQLLQAIHPIAVEYGYWTQIYNILRAGTIDSWAGQVFFSSWRTGANHVMPGRNLVSNLCSGSGDANLHFPRSPAEIPTHSLTIKDDIGSLTPDPMLDNLIFYLCFLESLTHTHWLEQVLSPNDQLGTVRSELVKRNRLIRQLELEGLEKRRQLLAAANALARTKNDQVSV